MPIFMGTTKQQAKGIALFATDHMKDQIEQIYEDISNYIDSTTEYDWQRNERLNDFILEQLLFFSHAVHSDPDQPITWKIELRYPKQLRMALCEKCMQKRCELIKEFMTKEAQVTEEE